MIGNTPVQREEKGNVIMQAMSCRPAAASSGGMEATTMTSRRTRWFFVSSHSSHGINEPTGLARDVEAW